jgi:hypothetical protein
MPFEHNSGLSGVYDRTPSKPEWARVLFREDNLAQAAELMEVQSIAEGRGRRISDRLMSDGNRVSGAEIIVNSDDGIVTLTAGRIYARGDVRDLPEAVFTDIPMTGDVVVGVRIVTTVLTEVDDPDMNGLHPGSDAEGEAGAGREAEAAAWGWIGDGVTGDLYQVYQLKDGTPIDQTAPSSLSDVSQAIALYDRDANGSYVVRGCKVRALGKIAGAQHFSIAEGVANILGLKRTRSYALRHQEAEAWDIGVVDAETHTFADGGTGTAIVPINRGPLSALVTAIITKEKTVSITKGVGGSADDLPDDSVSTIVSVSQGGTTYVATTDYLLTADRVDWSPGGAEPSPGSTYSVTYQYLDAVTPDALTDDTVELSGGVTGGVVLLSYTWKIPRADLLCLDNAGLPVYVKGISSTATPRAPSQPTTLLALAQIVNDWRGAPTVINTDVRSVPYEELWVYIRKLFDYGDLIALERLKSDIDTREPVAKKGVFVDPWDSDVLRDQGEPQTAAIFDGTMQLPIEASVHSLSLPSPALLDYSEAVVIRQELFTGCMKVNPYQNFTPLPISLGISPSVDFWTDRQTSWASPITRSIIAGFSGTSTATELLSEQDSDLPFLRQITVTFTAGGLAVGEAVSSVIFDGIDVTPGSPPVANASGVATGSFIVPANVPAGSKLVRLTSATGRTASALFVGQGKLEIDLMRRVTSISVQPERSNGGDGSGTVDPLAQTFTLTEARFICGADLRVCVVGDAANDMLVEIHPVENGIPTDDVLAQATVNMASVTAGTWISPRFSVPVWLNADREYALMIKTDDANHALSIASVGDFDAAAQRFVSGQPYSVGVLLSSSNAKTWTPHQDDDLAFRLIAAQFSPVAKTVDLGSVTVANMSDLLILAGVERPTADASVVFEVERADGSITEVFADQPWQLTEFVSEEIDVRAILRGSARVSPVLYPNAALIAGELQTSGDYVTRAFDMGAAIRMSAFLKSRLPAGSTLTVEIDKADDDWTAVSQHASTVLNDGWTEREYRQTPYTATEGRLRLTLTGTPAARPVLSDMRAVSI